MSTSLAAPRAPGIRAATVETHGRASHRRFLTWYVASLAVALLPFGVAVLVLYRAGELMPYADVVSRQQRDGSIYGVATFQNFFRYKVELSRARPAEAIAFGSSRVMQFREELFRVPFTNTGGAVTSLPVGRRFLDALADHPLPRVMFFGVDFWWFHPEWPSVVEPARLMRDATVLDQYRLSLPVLWLLNGRVGTARFADILAGRRHNDITHYDNIGVHAIETSAGFRPDGSYHYGNYYFGACTPPRAVARALGISDRRCVEVEPDVRFTRTLAMVRDRDADFRHALHLDPARVNDFRAIVEWAGARGIHLAVFLPPLAPPVAEAVRAGGVAFAYIDEVRDALRATLRGTGHAFHDLDGARTGLDDPCEYIDGTHPGDVVSARILAEIAGAAPDAVAARTIDVTRADAAIARASGRALTIFDPTKYNRREIDFLQLGCRK